MHRTFNALALLAAACIACSSFAQAADFPDRPITIVVPFVPGGGTDILSRLVAQRMSSELKQTVVVENKPGAGGTVGGALVANASPDGYTLYVASTATAMSAGLYKDLKFQPIKDFAPVALMGTMPFILVMSKNVPAKDLPEMLALARREPGSLTYGSAGFGSVNHVGMELFNSMAGTDIRHIPYKGSSAALVDVHGGRVSMMLDTVGSAVQYLKTDKSLIPVAVTSLDRSALVPDLPTVSELGPKGYELTVWYGLVAPKGTPLPVLEKLNIAVNRALENPALRERYASLGIETARSTVESFGTLMRADEKKWTDVIVSADIHLK
ncbi:MAG: tripartite tricarboxylate transporter substrate binding protein [Achromobacter veterisilvae]